VRPPLGDSEVTLRYRPRSFVIGARVSLVALPLALLLFVGGLRGGRRQAQTAAKASSRSAI
jgi:hypothetical protein